MAHAVIIAILVDLVPVGIETGLAGTVLGKENGRLPTSASSRTVLISPSLIAR